MDFVIWILLKYVLSVRMLINALNRHVIAYAVEYKAARAGRSEFCLHSAVAQLHILLTSFILCIHVK